jgi:hypothetical protein
VTLRIKLGAPSLSFDERGVFASDARLAFTVYSNIRRRHRLPASQLELIVADDFARTVRQHMSGSANGREAEPQFTTDRAGGLAVVAAKNLDQTGDAQNVVIVFDATHWRGVSEPARRLNALHILAHELAHPMLERAQHASGALAGVSLPSRTANEIARSMTRIMSGEYRADRLAELIVGACMSMTDGDGKSGPANLWATEGDAYYSSACSAIQAAHPAWPDLVQAYREGRLPLDEMWTRLVSSIDQALNLVVHTQALADAADARRDVLTSEPIGALPAARLYLLPFGAFLDEVRSQPLVQSLRATRILHDRVVSVGQNAMLQIWRNLGLTPIEHSDRTLELRVVAPLR